VKAENKVLGLACPLTLYLAFVRGPEGVMVELVQRCATADSG
jgi:hypothetical protein